MKIMQANFVVLAVSLTSNVAPPTQGLPHGLTLRAPAAKLRRAGGPAPCGRGTVRGDCLLLSPSSLFQRRNLRCFSVIFCLSRPLLSVVSLRQELAQRGAALLEGMDAMTVYEMRREGQPKRDYYGHSLDWTYKSRGCLGMEIELGKMVVLSRFVVPASRNPVKHHYCRARLE